jgi:hypothetical protein
MYWKYLPYFLINQSELQLRLQGLWFLHPAFGVGISYLRAFLLLYSWRFSLKNRKIANWKKKWFSQIEISTGQYDHHRITWSKSMAGREYFNIQHTFFIAIDYHFLYINSFYLILFRFPFSIRWISRRPDSRNKVATIAKMSMATLGKQISIQVGIADLFLHASSFYVCLSSDWVTKNLNSNFSACNNSQIEVNNQFYCFSNKINVYSGILEAQTLLLDSTAISVALRKTRQSVRRLKGLSPVFDFLPFHQH